MKNGCMVIEEFVKHQMIQEHLQGKRKYEVWQKYTGQRADHGYIIRWMRELGYEDKIDKFAFNKNVIMPKSTNLQKSHSEDFEIVQLKKRIHQLEQQLRDAELKAIAFSTMVDIAEQEFKIPIRKKYVTKPSNS